jgi:uncharacterized protein
MRPVILVFAKAPLPGRVKTRLHSVLTPEQAARLHKAFVLDTLESLNHLAAVADIELHSDALYPDWHFSYRLQCPGDLGQRMHFALTAALADGRPQALLIGTDSPTLPVTHLADLLASPADIALGPTEDGGYYAISARRTHTEMFAGVAWSTDRALNQTLTACTAAGLTTSTGPPWWDVDSPADLARLRAEICLPRHTRDILSACP